MVGKTKKTALEAGIPTFHLRAEAWECDFNGHWNTRYYCRAFQTAAEVAAMLDGNTDRDSLVVEQRQLRFHAELHGGDPVTIRSFDLADKGRTALTAHYMFCNGKVAATALDRGLPHNRHLTALGAADAALALPRGLTGPATKTWEPEPERDFLFELGPVRPWELHSDGNMQFWSGVARMSHASHHHDLGIGFTLERMKETGVGRMLAELRYTRLGPCSEGDFLRAASRMTRAAGKAFTTAHFLYTQRGAPVAMLDLCTLAVNMKTRRAIELPGFVTARLS